MGRTLRLCRSDLASREPGDSNLYHDYDSEEEPEDTIEMRVEKVRKRGESSPQLGFCSQRRDVWGRDCSKTPVQCPAVLPGSARTCSCNPGPSPSREEQAQAPHCPRPCRSEASDTPYAKHNPRPLALSAVRSRSVDARPRSSPRAGRGIRVVPTAAPPRRGPRSPSAPTPARPATPFCPRRRWHGLPRTADALAPSHTRVLSCHFGCGGRGWQGSTTSPSESHVPLILLSPTSVSGVLPPHLSRSSDPVPAPDGSPCVACHSISESC